MPVTDTDIVVIGGGSTGLALAYHIIAGDGGARLEILEERSVYHPDRTWCFWDFGELDPGLDALVRCRWNRWRFSGSGADIVHESATHPYCALDAGDYYRTVRDRIAASSSVKLVTGCRVEGVEPTDGGYALTTTRGELRCRRVIDTRPPYPHYTIGSGVEPPRTVPASLAGTPLFQIFFGVEIKTAAERFDPTTASLMTAMKSGDDGLEFIYLLPFSPTSALVEHTRFSTRFTGAEQLRDDCTRSIAELCGTDACTVVREEGAVLPMGLPHTTDNRADWIRAGIGGGALRPATGYGFIRTQRWAARCAAALRDGAAVPPMGDDFLERFLDRLFIDVLAAEPRLADRIFLGLGKKLPPDCFARFMMEKSTWRDYFRVIAAMPPLPFLRRLSARVAGG